MSAHAAYGNRALTTPARAGSHLPLNRGVNNTSTRARTRGEPLGLTKIRNYFRISRPHARGATEPEGPLACGIRSRPHARGATTAPAATA